mmetsp:Transcript_18440/g.33233  ORF Transcript_18440/g.33233 Transcript_18440/m.33233 type:complete len:141 (-) Transcript_18440:89-511(-)
MEIRDGTVYSKLVKFRASNSELLKDFSVLTNSKLTNVSQLEPVKPVQSEILNMRKRRTRQKKTYNTELEGILGFASLITETEQALKTKTEAEPTPVNSHVIASLASHEALALHTELLSEAVSLSPHQAEKLPHKQEVCKM